jgi:hypothetical protein
MSLGVRSKGRRVNTCPQDAQVLRDHVAAHEEARRDLTGLLRARGELLFAGTDFREGPRVFARQAVCFNLLQLEPLQAASLPLVHAIAQELGREEREASPHRDDA